MLERRVFSLFDFTHGYCSSHDRGIGWDLSLHNTTLLVGINGYSSYYRLNQKSLMFQECARYAFAPSAKKFTLHEIFWDTFHTFKRSCVSIYVDWRSVIGCVLCRFVRGNSACDVVLGALRNISQIPALNSGSLIAYTIGFDRELTPTKDASVIVMWK